MKDIGLKLKHLRKSRKMTQQDVSDRVKADISRSTISNYEIGRRTPHLSDLAALAELFGVGLDYFGFSSKDEVFELMARGKEIFENEAIDEEAKEALYHEFMKMYLDLKGMNSK